MTYTCTFRCKSINSVADFIQRIEGESIPYVRSWLDHVLRVTVDREDHAEKVDVIAKELDAKPETEWEDKDR